MTTAKFPVGPPFMGIVSDVPPPGDTTAFDDMLNMFCYKNRIQNRPAFGGVYSAPPDGGIVRNLIVHQDVLSLLHTLLLTSKNAYYMTSGWTYNRISALNGLQGTALPYGWVACQDRIYFCNGSTLVLYADGESLLKTAGDVPGGCRFLTQCANHVVGAYWTEPGMGGAGSTIFTKRVRWSKNGIGDNWTDVTSGFSDLLDVSEGISGLATLGRNVYIFRPNGISVMTPTGNGLQPFDFESFTYAPDGVGNNYPYSLFIYDNKAFFISRDDIWFMTGSGINRIGGGKAKSKIFADINLASGDQIVGMGTSTMSYGYDFASYWISIPGVNVSWVYNIEADNWTRVNSSKGRLTAIHAVGTV